MQLFLAAPCPHCQIWQGQKSGFGTRDFGVFSVIVRANFFGADELWQLARGSLGGHGRRPRNREDTIILHRDAALCGTLSDVVV
jgi:hypothetical protein